MLSHREQVGRLRVLAVRALAAYTLADPRLTFVTHGENTTFKVSAAAGGGPPERFLLRVHRPARHGRFIDSGAAIRSELRWLTADLHLDNALFAGREVRLIDFDDCGVGYRLYDVAVALWELRYRADYEAFRTALIAGYTAHRPLPADHLAHLDEFIAIREVAFGLWYVGTAQVNPTFRDRVPEVLAGIARSLAALQPA
jgi:Ser/Thr protein kinase RdoA (MazF antagonist)